MKNMIKLPAMVLGLMLLITGFTQKVMAQEEDVSLETFYQELAPYGTWTQDPDYGYVWRPEVDMSNFQPYYTDGHWAMTEYGNTWVSDYDWGWAPFHYGRWIRNRFNDWIWIPDTVWGPAWVTWRSGGGYYGWAPLGPGYDIEENADEGGYNIPNDWWVFIPQINIYNNSYPHYNRNLNIFNQTTYINYTSGRNRHNFYTGPRAEDIRRVTRRDVKVYQVARSSRPGRTSISNNNTINIYNPGTGRRGNNTPNGQSGQPGRNVRGNSQTPGQPAGNTNPVVNGQNGQPGRGGRGNSQIPGQPAGNTNPVVNGQPGSGSGRGGRGNNQTPGQPTGNTNPVVNGQPGANPGRRSDMGVRPSVDGRDRTQRIQQGNSQQQQAQHQAQQQAQQQRQQQMQQQQRDGQQRQQQAQQQQAQQQQAQQRQQQMQRQQRDAQQRQQQAQQQQAQQRVQQQAQQQQAQQRQQQAQQQAQQRQQQQRQQQDQQRQQQQQQRQQQEQQQRQQQQQQAPPGRGGRGN